MFKEKYDLLIEAAKNRPIIENEYYETHHIIPKSLGGSNDKSNLVQLTPEEHYLAHYYLWKFTNTLQMANAFWFMCIHKGHTLTKEEYGELRRQAAKFSAERQKKPVYCLELDKEFDSCKEATKFVTGSSKNSQYIGQVCNKKHKSAFIWKDNLKYHWCWLEEKEEFKKHKEELLYEEAHKQEIINKNISKAKKGVKVSGTEIYCVEANKAFKSLVEAAEFCNGHTEYLKAAAMNGKPYHNYHWRMKGYNPELTEKISHWKGKTLPEEAKKKLSEARSEKIKCIETGVVFNSLKNAMEWLNKKGSGSCLKQAVKEGKEYSGYHWELIQKAERKIRCIELNKVFNNAKEAANFLQKPSGNYILDRIEAGLSSYGYHWEYADTQNKTEIKERKKKGIKIKCIETGEVFSSLKAVADYLNLSAVSISKFLIKAIENKTEYKKCHWKYA